VYIPIEAFSGAQFFGNFYELFHHNIGICKNPRRKKKSFYIISSIKLSGKVYQFLNGETAALYICRGPVHAIGAVKFAGIGIQDFEKADAAAVFCPAMANPRVNSLPKAAFSPA
jgi:hypothetical protein